MAYAVYPRQRQTGSLYVQRRRLQRHRRRHPQTRTNQYLQQHVRLLSGLYGILRPLDLMQPYRLEMGTAFANTRG